MGMASKNDENSWKYQNEYYKLARSFITLC
jgi:hypothetical protein